MEDKPVVSWTCVGTTPHRSIIRLRGPTRYSGANLESSHDVAQNYTLLSALPHALHV